MITSAYIHVYVHETAELHMTTMSNKYIHKYDICGDRWNLNKPSIMPSVKSDFHRAASGLTNKHNGYKKTFNRRRGCTSVRHRL